MHIKEVYIYTNGNVMAFNEDGEQVVKCQGFIFDVANKLAEWCDEKTKFSFGQWKGTMLPCDFSWWFKKT